MLKKHPATYTTPPTCTSLYRMHVNFTRGVPFFSQYECEFSMPIIEMCVHSILYNPFHKILGPCCLSSLLKLNDMHYYIVKQGDESLVFKVKDSFIVAMYVQSYKNSDVLQRQISWSICIHDKENKSILSTDGPIISISIL